MSIVSPEGRLLYTRSLWQPRRFKNNPENPAKYSCSLVIDKANPDLAPLIALFNESAMTIEGTAPPAVEGGLCILPYGKRSCILDGAVRYPADPFYADKLILSASRGEENGQPSILLGPGQPVIDKAEIYDGVVARLLVSFYPYAGGTGGVNGDVHGVLKIRDADKIGRNEEDAGAAFAAAGFQGSGATVAPVQAAPAGFGVPGQPVQQPFPGQPVQQPVYAAQPVPGAPVQPTVQPGAIGTPPATPWG